MLLSLFVSDLSLEGVRGCAQWHLGVNTSFVLGQPRQPLNNNKGPEYGRWTSAAWRQAVQYGIETASIRSPSSVAPAGDLRTMLNEKGGADKPEGTCPSLSPTALREVPHSEKGAKGAESRACRDEAIKLIQVNTW